MTTPRYVALCLVAGVLAFGAGSAASWLLGRTASATGGDGAFAEAMLAQLVPAVLDDEPAAARQSLLKTLLRHLHDRFV